MSATSDMQLQLAMRAPRRRFCPAQHCSVPCGLGIGITCTCRPCSCARCRRAPRRDRVQTTVETFRPVGAAPLPRPLFPSRPTPTKEPA